MRRTTRPLLRAAHTSYVDVPRTEPATVLADRMWTVSTARPPTTTVSMPTTVLLMVTVEVGFVQCIVQALPGASAAGRAGPSQV